MAFSLDPEELREPPALSDAGWPLVDDRVDPEVEASLWRRWKSGEAAARDELAALYLPFARAQAARCYARRVHDGFEFGEYHHFAVVGMLESLDRFAPDRGVGFKTFATKRILGAVINGLEKLSEQQQQVALRQRLARGRAESLAEGTTLDREQQLLHELGEIGIGLALGFILEGTGMLARAGDTVPDNAYTDVEARHLRNQLWGFVSQLTAREAEVIRMHYLQQQTFEEIAGVLQLTKGRISQLHRQALERLRHMLVQPRGIDVAL